MHLPRSPPWTDLDEISHSGRVLDADNSAIFVNLFRGIYSVGFKFCRSPLTWAVAVNAALLYSAPVTTTGSNLLLNVKARSIVDHRHRFRRRFKSSAVSRQKKYVIYQNNRIYCREEKSCNKYTCCCLDGQPTNDAHGLYVLPIQVDVQPMCIISCLPVDCLFIFLLLLFICFFICYYHADNAWQIKAEYTNKKKNHISRICPEAPRERIWMKSDIVVESWT